MINFRFEIMVMSKTEASREQCLAGCVLEQLREQDSSRESRERLHGIWKCIRVWELYQAFKFDLLSPFHREKEKHLREREIALKMPGRKGVNTSHVHSIIRQKHAAMRMEKACTTSESFKHRQVWKSSPEMQTWEMIFASSRVFFFFLRLEFMKVKNKYE